MTYLLAILGIIMVVTLSFILEKKCKQSDFIEFISRNTLTIFSVSFIVIWNLHRLELLLDTNFDFIKKSSYLYALLVLLICMIIADMVENYLPFLISKKRKVSAKI